MNSIIGIMWNKNEGDILEEIITDALPHIDSLFLADDHSTDNSWEIIKSFSKHPKVEYIRNQRDNNKDAGQRQSLLNEIRKRYKPENTWVQVIESDVMILDTNIREAVKESNISDVAVSWQLINAVRQNWDEDNYPNWKISIKEIMPLGHRIEAMVYTFRPLPDLFYNLDTWSPWPGGFNHYTQIPVFNQKKTRQSPLLAHYGYRGPTHFYKKYNPKGLNIRHKKYKDWDLSSIEKIKETVPFFNGVYSGQSHEMSRYGWKKSRSSRQWSRLEK